MHRRAETSSDLSATRAEDDRAPARDAVAAISTAAGEAAIALVRVSGSGAIAIADRVFRGRCRPSEFESHVQHLGEVIDEHDQRIDQVMISVHRAPASYTGEDLVEISCHGGTLVPAKVLEACLRAGARAARRGEFTERAFLNGKMDLTQAEAVIDLIRAKTDLALRSAMEQLEGSLGRKILQIRQALVDLVAHLEASIDFAEEGIAPDEGETLRGRLGSIRNQIAELLATAHQGRILREGVRVVIFGATNAGKSSLLNRLLGYERVIVSEIHGTTRDTIEETINLGGVAVRLLDTAGLREVADEVERAGIVRTEKSLEIADLLVHVVDRNAARPPHFDRERERNGAAIVVLNKSDLPEHDDWRTLEGLRLSCATGEGIAQLEHEMFARIARHNLQPENAMAINARHRDCLRRALAACDCAATALANDISPEYVVVELSEALAAVGEVTGAVGVEQILDSVFSQFCIGK